MKSFPALSRNKETIFGKVNCTLLSWISFTLFDRKTEIREYSVETAQPSAPARSTAPGLIAERASRGTSDHERCGTC